ncbi:centrosomal protein of 128 kDa [Lissotriton helveticus]
MAESSSDSDSFHRNRPSKRGPLRATHGRTRGAGVGDVTEKIHTLASTLQDTNRNLRHVDQMLGQYREHNSEQTEAMATLKERLEQSIDELRSQRMSRLSGARSASLSSLYASDLEGPTATGSQRFVPTSPLRDYVNSRDARPRRSRSASVRFIDDMNQTGQVHSLHQSLRDLSSEQLRLGDDLNREFSRRQRVEVETKKTLDHLSERLSDPQRQESVSERVERRLQELEKEMRLERQQVERRQDHLGQMSVQLQEALKKRDAKPEEIAESAKSKLIKSETEKSLLEQELDRSRRRLDQSEGSRETLLLQVEDLRSQLLRAEDDRLHLQHQVSQTSLHNKSRHESHEEERRLDAVLERSEREKRDLEKQILELRAQLNHSAVMSEVEELKRSMDRKDRERVQLTAHVEVLTSDLEKREKQQLRMLEQLKEIQARYESCEADRRRAELQSAELVQQAEDAAREGDQYVAELRQAEALRLESERKKEELKIKAQETIRQWRLKCKKLERDLENQGEAAGEQTERNNQLVKEKDELKSQLQAAMHQIENLRKELSDVLAKRAQQEEELHCRDVKIQESRTQKMELERELRETRDIISQLEADVQRHRELQHQLREDKDRLEEELSEVNHMRAKDNDRLLEMQETIKDLSALRVELTNRLAEEEKANKDLRKTISEVQKEQEFAQEELANASRQLKMERDIHQRELSDLRSGAQNTKSKQERNVQEMLGHFRQEREEMENHIKTLKAELIEDKNMIKSQRRQVEKMKVECDKLTDQMTQMEEEDVKLRRKYQLLKQDIEEKDKQISKGEDHLRMLEEAGLQLRDQLCRLETEQETILNLIGSEIDASCKVLSRDSAEKFKAISIAPGLQKDPHRWLAETKTKLQWICEEVKEREGKERKVRRHLQQSREQLKDLNINKDSERQALFEQITRKEQLLEDLHREKRDLLEKTRRQDDEMRALQDRVVDLEMSTRVALDHLESVPEKLSLLEDVKGLGESQQQREIIEERYSKYREIVSSLQQQLEDSKRRIQEYRAEKKNADAQSSRLGALSSSLRGQHSFLSSSLLSDSALSQKRVVPLDFDDSLGVTINGSKS